MLGGRDFTDGSLWLAAAGVPVIDVNALPTTTLDDAAPWLFTLRTAQDVLYRSFVRWAQRGGHLDGRVIGVFCDRLTRQSAAAAVDELHRLGHEVRTVDRLRGASERAASTTSRPRSASPPTASTCVLGFVGGSSWINTLARRRPPSATDRTSSTWRRGSTPTTSPPADIRQDLYDGTLALTMSRVGDVAAGWPLAAETDQAR